MPLTPQEIAAAGSPTPPSLPSRASGNAQNSAVDLFNVWMRQQPWYTQFFQSIGQDPNRAKLSDGQRRQLQQAMTAHGYDLSQSGGMNIDPAGNLNDPHGFASQPTWLKAIEIAAPVAASAFVPGGQAAWGSLGDALGIGGSTVAPAATAGGAGIAGGAAGAAPAVASGSTVGSLLGIGAGAAPVINKAASSGGISFGDIIKSAIAPTIGAVTGLITSSKQGAQADKALQAQLDAQKYGVDAQTASAAAQLDFAKTQAAQQQQQFQSTQDKNYQLYLEQQARLAPYRNLGAGAVARIGQPITVGSLLGVA